MQTQTGKDPEPHAFTFTSPTTARDEAEAIKDALSKLIQAARPGAGMLSTSGVSASANSTSAALAIASVVSSLPKSGMETSAWHEDGQLKGDVELQQSLLNSNPLLKRTFMESLRIKPGSITNSQFTYQFWSTRIHLLRAHAIEKNQTKGAYNVLSTIKTKEENTNKLTISKEQIQLIFKQHPLVKRVYDENVPKLSEEAFWSAFFQSRLFKKLKGEKISEEDPTNAILDRYLQLNDDEERNQRLLASNVPHIIDLEGNEENHSQKKGNKPDFTMRPTAMDRVPIIRTLNSLSEKIMSQVPPNDIDPSLPIGIDEETFNSLALRDLQADAEENRVILKVKDQSHFFSSNKENGVSADALRYAEQDPVQVLQSLQADLAHSISNLNLETAIGVDDNSDSDDDDNTHSKQKHVGSKSSLSAATSQILSAIAQQRAQTDDPSSLTPGFSTAPTAQTSLFGLSPSISDRLSLTHATATEFLQHFWSAFLSGDPDRAEEIAKLIETLDRAMDRIRAVADDAETERNKEVDRIKQHIQDRFERTQRKIKFDFESIGGGAKVVNQLLAPTVKAIQVAGSGYRKALALEREEAGQEAKVSGVR